MAHVLIGVPSSGFVRAGFSYSLATLVAASQAMPKAIPGEEFAIGLAFMEGSVIHSNREKLGQALLDDPQLTHLLFIDDDMKFQPAALMCLLSRRHPIVTTNYVMKQKRREFLAVGLDGKRLPTTKESAGLEAISYSGFGFSLFARKVFEVVPQPWFAPEWIPEAKQYTTEDNPFYRKCREAGFTVWLDHEASRMIEHIGTTTFTWNSAEDQPDGK